MKENQDLRCRVIQYPVLDSSTIMCLGTYSLIIGALSFPTSLRLSGEVRSNFFFLPYKHEWTFIHL